MDDVKSPSWRMRSYGRITGGQLERLLASFSLIWEERESFTWIRGNSDEWVHSFEKIVGIPNWAPLYELDLVRLVALLAVRSGLGEKIAGAAKEGIEALVDLAETMPEDFSPSPDALPASMAMLGNLEAISVYSRSINDMVKAAKRGDFDSLMQAISVDAYVLCFPFFLAGIRVDQLSGQEDAIEEVFRALRGPHERRYDFVKLRWAEYLLRDQGAFDACSREDIYVLLVENLKLYDPAGTKKDPKSAIFAMFRKWQKEAGIQNPRFGFSGKRKA